MKRIAVALADRPYEVVVGAGALVEVAAIVGDRRRCVVVTQPGAAEHARQVRDALGESELLVIDDGEGAKSLFTVEALCKRFAASGLLRADAIVAVGGGVVGDTAGFAAAVYHRGIDVVHVPTTLLAMVDSAIGGKTGVNLSEGKNLVGAFHQPIGVVADVTTLETLPEREYRCGLGEVAKYALMGDDELDRVLAERADRLISRDPATVTDVVARCAAIKAGIVAADPEERTGLRARLNYGHTFAHALEAAGGYALAHGEAVAIGLVFAGELARALERIDNGTADAHRDLVASLGLPVTAPRGARGDELLALMRRDKKASGGLTFVLRGPGGLEIVEDPPAPALDRAFRAVGVEG